MTINPKAPPPGPGPWKFKHPAMACVFELIIRHPDPVYARESARAAFQRVDDLEKELSRFRNDSDIARIGAAPARQPIRIGSAAVDCIVIAHEVWTHSRGAFDPTVGPLVDYWRTQPDAPFRPPPSNLLQDVGMHLLHLDPDRHEITKERDGLTIDLGGIAKGYAIDEAARLLHDDWEIGHFLIHSGWSTVYARGFSTAGDDSWSGLIETCAEPPIRVPLNSAALSGSAAVEKARHVVDPRNGLPLLPDQRAWSLAPNAALADALSTAAAFLDHVEIETLCGAFTDSGLIVSRKSTTGAETFRAGRFVTSSW